MWLWEMKKSCLPHKDARHCSFEDIQATDPLTVIDWKWENDRFIVLIYEIGWLVCDLIQSEDSEEAVRDLLCNRWVAAQYAEMAYFHVNLIEKGLLES